MHVNQTAHHTVHDIEIIQVVNIAAILTFYDQPGMTSDLKRTYMVTAVTFSFSAIRPAVIPAGNQNPIHPKTR